MKNFIEKVSDNFAEKAKYVEIFLTDLRDNIFDKNNFNKIKAKIFRREEENYSVGNGAVGNGAVGNTCSQGISSNISNPSNTSNPSNPSSFGCSNGIQIIPKVPIVQIDVDGDEGCLSKKKKKSIYKNKKLNMIKKAENLIKTKNNKSNKPTTPKSKSEIDSITQDCNTNINFINKNIINGENINSSFISCSMNSDGIFNFKKANRLSNPTKYMMKKQKLKQNQSNENINIMEDNNKGKNDKDKYDKDNEVDKYKDDKDKENKDNEDKDKEVDKDNEVDKDKEDKDKELTNTKISSCNKSNYSNYSDYWKDNNSFQEDIYWNSTTALDTNKVNWPTMSLSIYSNIIPSKLIKN